MRQLRWLLILIVLLSLSSVVLAQTQNHLPSRNRIGRGAVQSAEWHPSGEYILVSTVRGAWLYTPDLQDFAHIPDAQLATLSPDGRYIAGVDDTHRVRLWDAHTLEPVDSPDRGAFRRIWTLAWSADGRYLAAAGNRDEDLIYAWDFFNAQNTVFVTRYSADKLMWSPKGHHLAMLTTSTGSFFVFNMQERTTTLSHRATGILPYGASAVWQDENHLLTLIYDENTDAVLWNIITGEQIDTRGLAGHARPQFSHNGGSMATGTLGGVNFSRLSDGENIRVEIEPDYFGTHILSWSYDDRWLAAGTYSSSRQVVAEVLLIDALTGEAVHRLGGTWQSIQQLAWSRDSQSLLVVDERQRMLVYGAALGETRAYNDAHTLVGETLAWRSDSTQIIIAGSHEGFTLWDLQQEAQLKRFSSGLLLPVTDINWQPNGDLVVVQMRERPGTMQVGASLAVELWDLLDGENRINTLGFDPVFTIDFFDWHPDGTKFAALSGDTLYIRDIASGASSTEATSDYPWRDVQGLLWSPSGDYILLLMFGHGTGGSYIYNVDADAFTLGSGYLLRGEVVWAPDDRLISLRWGTWGDPTPPQLITLGLSRLAEPYFFQTPDDLKSGFFLLQGLQTNSRQGFLSPNGNYAAAVDDAYNGMLWDATTGNPLAMLANVAQIAWSPDESHLVVQRLDGSLWVLNANGTIRTPLPVIASVQEPVGRFFWSPDSSHLAHLYNGVIDLWHLND